MDIRKELKTIKDNPESVGDLIEDINEQLQVLRKEEYLHKVAYVANEIEKLINIEDFKICGVSTIQICNITQYEGDYKVDFYFINHNGQGRDWNITVNNKPLKNFLEELTEKIGRFDIDVCSEEFANHFNSHKLELKSGLKEKIMNLLLSEELKLWEINHDSLSSTINRVELEQEELKKKSHILKVISISNEIENLVKEGVFEKENIDGMRLYIANHYEEDTSCEVKLLKNKEEVYRYDDSEGCIKLFDTLENLFSSITEFDHEFTNHDIRDKQFELKAGISEELAKNLLSEDLSAHLTKNLMYNSIDSALSQLDSELPQPKNNTGKKPKL